MKKYKEKKIMKKSLIALILTVALVVPVFAQKGDMSVNAKLGLGLSNNIKNGEDDISSTFKLNMPVSLGAEFFYGVMDNLSVGFGVSYVFDAEAKSEDPAFNSKIKAGTTNVYLAVKPEAKIESEIFSSIYAIGQIGLTTARANVKNDHYGIDESPAIDSGLYLGLGFGTIISSLTTKYRDLQIFFTFLIQLWMYATPIVYPLSQTKGMQWLGIPVHKLMCLNPVTPVLETFKYGFLSAGEFVGWRWLIYSFLFMILVLSTGIVIFNKVQKSFMDTV